MQLLKYRRLGPASIPDGFNGIDALVEVNWQKKQVCSVFKRIYRACVYLIWHSIDLMSSIWRCSNELRELYFESVEAW
jgi:hypothetical protein